MLGKKLFGVLVALTLTTSTIGVSAQTLSANSTKGNTAISAKQDVKTHYVKANEERLIKMLRQNGTIPQNATPEQVQAILAEYLKNDASEPEMELLSKQDRILNESRMQKASNFSFNKPKVYQKGAMNEAGVQEREYTGQVRTAKPLVILMEFQDFEHNNIKPEETDRFYADYSPEHYTNMLFGDEKFIGPDGQPYYTMKQYYEAQSGGSYSVNGKVAGWYKAKGTAADYGAHSGSAKDVNARGLVKEALDAAAQDPTINLAEYDIEDRYDADRDGNYWEPDGIIDHVIVVHAGGGEEDGGGAIGENAIWSHRSKISSQNYKIAGTNLYANDYTMCPEDGGTVFYHEYGHDLGLPDEYDTVYSGQGEPVSFWSLMASGNWAGKIPGTEASGFSPWAKQFLQANMGGNWQKGSTVNLADITEQGVELVLDQASSKGVNNEVVKINLPKKENIIVKPTSGAYAYYGGTGKDGAAIKNAMSTTVDLTGKTSAMLTFKTQYDIEQGWDFASVQVKEEGSDTWVAVQGNITTSERDPQATVLVEHGITGSSNKQWVDAMFNLSAYAGKKIELKFEYETDEYSFGAGFYMDDIKVVGDDQVILTDDVEGTGAFTLGGFNKDNGIVYSNHYYLVEWRNHQGVDEALAHIPRGEGTLMSYDPGLLVWYVDDFYTDNWVGNHPGDGFLGVVDADQTPVTWDFADGKQTIASSSYQIHDAAFGIRKNSKMFLNYGNLYGRNAVDNQTFMRPIFDDSKDYTNKHMDDAGRKVPNYGLKIYVTGENKDRSSATIRIMK